MTSEVPIRNFVMLDFRSAERLTDEVREFLGKGWRLHGDASVHSEPVGDDSVVMHFCQGLVRPQATSKSSAPRPRA